VSDKIKAVSNYFLMPKAYIFICIQYVQKISEKFVSNNESEKIK
jgi:hypothetical protein